MHSVRADMILANFCKAVLATCLEVKERNEITAIEFGCVACASKATLLGPRSCCKTKSQTFVVGVRQKQLQTHFNIELAAFLHFAVTGPRMHLITVETFCVFLRCRRWLSVAAAG